MTIGNGPDDAVALLGDCVLWEVLAIAKLWPNTAIEEAREQVRQLEEKRKTNSSEDVIYCCDEVLAAIAAVDAADKRPLLIGKLAALRLPGVTKKYIENEVDQLRWAVHTERQQAKQRVLREEQNRIPLNTLQLVRNLIRFYSERRGLGPGVALIEAFFCLMTYVFDVCDTVPYLLYVSATASCGKSTSLERHEAVCCRTRKFTDPSPAVIYRLIEDEQPTVLLDEAEILDDKSPRAAEIKALFNEGYKRSGQVPRCEEENGKRVIKWYRVYGPKILAKIGNFTGTILSRGIVIHLTRTYKLLQSFSYFVQEQAAPLRELLEAYATQKRAALVEIYKQQRDQNSWPFLAAREYEIFMPLLLHARLIGNECGEEGRKFEAEAVDVVRAFTTHKIDLVGAEDEQAARTLELLEVLEDELGRLLTTKRTVPAKWKETDSNWIAPGVLLERLSKKESWGDHLEWRKHDKARVIAIGHFLRSFDAESEHVETGTRYNLLDLAHKLAEHVPPGIPPEPFDDIPNFRTLLLDLDEEESPPTPPKKDTSQVTPKDFADVSSRYGSSCEEPDGDTSLDPPTGNLKKCSGNSSADNSKVTDNSNSEVVSHQPTSNEELRESTDNLTTITRGKTTSYMSSIPSDISSDGAQSNTHAIDPPEKDVRLSAKPTTDSLETGYELTTQDSELSAGLSAGPGLSAQDEGAKGTPDTTKNNDNITPAAGSGFIVEDL